MPGRIEFDPAMRKIGDAVAHVSDKLNGTSPGYAFYHMWVELDGRQYFVAISPSLSQNPPEKGSQNDQTA